MPPYSQENLLYRYQYYLLFHDVVSTVQPSTLYAFTSSVELYINIGNQLTDMCS